MKRSRAPSQLARKAPAKARKVTVVPVRRGPFGVPRAVGKVNTGFPKQIQIKHRYVEANIITTGLGTVGTLQFSVNGMFDPTTAAGGHQPMYFDQANAIYNHYTVLSSKISVQFNVEGATPPSVICGVYIEDDNTITPGGSAAMCEQPSAAYHLTVSGRADTPLLIQKSWSAKEAFGGDIMDNDDLKGDSGNNPVEQQFFTVFAQDAASGAVTNVRLLVTIEYLAVWDELKNLASS